MGPFRFGVSAQAAYDAGGWVELARRVETSGLSTLLVPDHFTTPMAAGPLLVAAAAATTTLRVGSLVYDNDFRHPALLAKEAATIDVLSGGRLELGVGAGWLKEEYDRVGLHFATPAERAGRLEEAVEVLVRLLAGEEVEFAGEHYRLRGLVGCPLPVQRPVPLLVGAGGPRLLRLAARRAQVVGLAPRSLPGGGLDVGDLGPGAMDAKVRVLDAAVAEGSWSDQGPERSVLLQAAFPSAEEGAARFGVPPAALEGSPHFLVGDPGRMEETVRARAERWGITYYVCFDRDLEALLPLVRRLSG